MEIHSIQKYTWLRYSSQLEMDRLFYDIGFNIYFHNVVLKAKEYK